jgi:ankyrin repeat protein
MGGVIKVCIIFCLLICLVGLSYFSGRDATGANRLIALLGRLDPRVSEGQGQGALLLLPKLFEAVKAGNVDRARILLTAGAPADVPGNVTSYTPLFTAIKNNNPQMVSLLLEYGADPYRITEEGLFPMHAAVQPDILGEDEDYKGAEIIKALLSRGVSVNQRDFDGRTPLMLACASFKTATARFLLDNGAASDGEDDTGRTAIEIAEQSGNGDCVDLLKNTAQKGE